MDYFNTVTGSILIAIFITIFIYKRSQKSRRSNIPPGPYPLPLIGTIYKHGIDITADALLKLSKDCGAIYRLYMGPQSIIVLNSYDAIRESISRPTEFSHRGMTDKYSWQRIRTKQMHGLFAREYDSTLIQERNACIAIMKKLGMGKTVIEDKILEEIDAVCDILKNGNYMDLRDLIHTSMLNVMIHILLNKRLEHGDPKALALLQNVDNAIKNVLFRTVIDSVPLLRFIPPFSGIHNTFVTGAQGTIDFMEEHAIPLLKDFDPERTDSFVESYFANNYDEGKKNVNVDINVFKHVLSDLIIGGLESSATGVRWTILILANRQDIQEKLYNEIITNTTDGPIRHSDKDQLPYLEAFLSEVLRYFTLLPFNLHQSCDKDTELCGFTIPRNSMILSNVMDEKTWGDPYVFRPERFINSDGRFEKHSHVFPFSFGKRACPGEILARQELYLFTGNLVKRLQFLPPDGVDKLDEEPLRDSVWCPKPFNVKVIPR